MTPDTSPNAEATAALMRSVIGRIATGPELSKDLPTEEARAAMRAILQGRADPVQAAIFLIALRMKRETDEENEGVLAALLDETPVLVAPVDEVACLGDPYDGFARTLPASPFLPPLLAACGLPTVSHGAASMGPKFGLTHRQVLEAAGQPVDATPQEAARRLADAGCGWSYLDQERLCPPLHALQDLRTRIVKRTVLTTTEVMLAPVRGRRATRLVTGYVHKPYPRIYARLARQAGFDSALIVRGVEGGVVPSLRQAGRAFQYHEGGEEAAVDFVPQDLGIDQSVLAPALPGAASAGEAAGTTRLDLARAAAAAAQAGLAALEGAPGPTRDGLVCAAGLVLWHARRHESLRACADEARAALDSGGARRRLA